MKDRVLIVGRQVLDFYGVVRSGCKTIHEGLYFIGFNDYFGRFHEMAREARQLRQIIASESA